MKFTTVISAYIEAYRFFGLLVHSEVTNYEAVQVSKTELVTLSKSFKDRPLKREEGKELYSELTNIQKSNVITKMKNELSTLDKVFEDALVLVLAEGDNDKLLNNKKKEILFSEFDEILKTELKQIAFSYVNLMRLTKLEHGIKGVTYLVECKGINNPQWWAHTQMNDFSVSSLKHSLDLIKVSTTKGSNIEKSRYLANGSGALFPVNITAAYLIDAFKAVSPIIDSQNKNLSGFINRYSSNIGNGYSHIGTAKQAQLYAKAYHYEKLFRQLKMHLNIITLGGFGYPLKQTHFEFMRYHFWRFNNLSLKKKLLG